MRQTFSVSFFLKKKHQISDKPQSIVARITVNGQSAELSTHLKCSIKDWETSKQQLKGSTCTSLTFNSSLHDIRSRINYIFHQQTLHRESTLPQVIKEIYLDESRTRHHLLAFFEIHNENIKKQIGKGRSKATYQKYEVIRKHLKKYLQEHQLLNVSKRTLQRYRSAGELTYITIHHKIFYTEKNVEKFIHDHFPKGENSIEEEPSD